MPCAVSGGTRWFLAGRWADSLLRRVKTSRAGWLRVGVAAEALGDLHATRRSRLSKESLCTVRSMRVSVLHDKDDAQAPGMDVRAGAQGQEF
eukprot:1159720-Pelagomonas_calceolata.AAC.2